MVGGVDAMIYYRIESGELQIVIADIINRDDLL